MTQKTTLNFDVKELNSVIYDRVKELYETEIDTKIDFLIKLKENKSFDSMLKYLDLQVCLQLRGKKYIDPERKREICRANGKKGGAPKGNKNRVKKEAQQIIQPSAETL